MNAPKDIKITDIVAAVVVITVAVFCTMGFYHLRVRSVNQETMKHPVYYSVFVHNLIRASGAQCHNDRKCHAAWAKTELPKIMNEERGFSNVDLKRVQLDVFYNASGQAESDRIHQMLPEPLYSELMNSNSPK